MKMAEYGIEKLTIHVVGADDLIEFLDIHHNYHAETDDKGNPDFYIDSIIRMNGCGCVTYDSPNHKLEKEYNNMLKAAGCYITVRVG